MNGIDVDKLPYNHDNFSKVKAYCVEMENLVMKLNSALILAEKKAPAKATVKKGK